MIASLVLIGLAKLFSRRRAMGTDNAEATVSRSDLGYLCYLAGLVLAVSCWLCLTVGALP